MRDKKEFFERLLNLIPLGRENAIPQSVLAELLKVQVSALKSYVLSARLNGYFVIGDQNGYYRPETLAEMVDYYQYMHQGAITRLRSLKPLKDILKKYGVDKPENGLPLFVDGSELVEDRNPVKNSSKYKPFQTCLIFYTNDLFDFSEPEEESE